MRISEGGRLGFCIGVATACLDPKARKQSDVAHEFYLLDSLSGVFTCNNYSTT